MASGNLTDKHWKAACLTIHGAFQGNVEDTSPSVEEPKNLLEFLDYHLCIRGAGEDHGLSIKSPINGILFRSNDYRADPSTIERISNLNTANPSFAKGVFSLMYPHNTSSLRVAAVDMMGVVPARWFDSTAPIMEPEEMSGFCEHLAVPVVDHASNGFYIQRYSVATSFETLRSPEWRKHIVSRSWDQLAYCAQIEEQESFKWCLWKAIELLEFTRGLPDHEGSRRI